MEFTSLDPASIDDAVSLLTPAWPAGTAHRIRPRLLAGTTLHPVTEAITDNHDRLIGVLHISDDPTYADSVGAAVAVHPFHRRKGIGRRLSDRAMELFQMRESPRTPLVLLREENEGGRQLAEGCGFRVASRSVGWETNFALGAAAPHRNALAAFDREKNISVAEVTLQTHGKQIEAVNHRAVAGLPRATGQHDEPDTTSAWTYVFSATSTILLATIGASPAGISVISPGDGTEPWYIEFTGVDPDARGLGVARALKHAQFLAAIEGGGVGIRTYNAEDNAHILALNESFGMSRRPGYVGMAM